VTLRAISREMGMTAPALYRYFENLDGLVEALCAALYDECTEFLRFRQDELAEDDVTGRLGAACRAFREWSMAHPAEFTLMFASPGTGPAAARDAAGDAAGGAAGSAPDPGPAHAAGMRFAGVFVELFVRLWERDGFPIPTPEEMGPALTGQFEAFRAESGIPLPVGAVQVFTSCWIRLYGMVALEVFGHLHVTLEDGAPMFEAELTAIARQLEIDWPPAAHLSRDAGEGQGRSLFQG
jgi:AcrR family transcriptional regulator